MSKKKKLNSNNPRYLKIEKSKKYKRILIREVKGCKIYNLYEIF